MGRGERIRIRSVIERECERIKIEGEKMEERDKNESLSVRVHFWRAGIWQIPNWLIPTLVGVGNSLWGW